MLWRRGWDMKSLTYRPYRTITCFSFSLSKNTKACFYRCFKIDHIKSKTKTAVLHGDFNRGHRFPLLYGCILRTADQSELLCGACSSQKWEQNSSSRSEQSTKADTRSNKLNTQSTEHPDPDSDSLPCNTVQSKHTQS